MSDHRAQFISSDRRVAVLVVLTAILVFVSVLARVILGPSYLSFAASLLTLGALLFALRMWPDLIRGPQVNWPKSDTRVVVEPLPMWFYAVFFTAMWTTVMAIRSSIDYPQQHAIDYLPTVVTWGSGGTAFGVAMGWVVHRNLAQRKARADGTRLAAPAFWLIVGCALLLGAACWLPITILDLARGFEPATAAKFHAIAVLVSGALGAMIWSVEYYKARK